jgi:hypothetical protein
MGFTAVSGADGWDLGEEGVMAQYKDENISGKTNGN